ncbi:MAG TPA: hypothetical protein V6D15_05290 [Oculatellaceae cyanobacterium]
MNYRNTESSILTHGWGDHLRKCDSLLQRKGRYAIFMRSSVRIAMRYAQATPTRFARLITRLHLMPPKVWQLKIKLFEPFFRTI